MLEQRESGAIDEVSTMEKGVKQRLRCCTDSDSESECAEVSSHL